LVAFVVKFDWPLGRRGMDHHANHDAKDKS
jgi:hypothetical protein